MNQLCSPRVPAKEIVANVATVVSFVRLEVAVVSGIHQVHQRTVTVGGKEFIPLATPHNLEHIPAGTTKK